MGGFETYLERNLALSVFLSNWIGQKGAFEEAAAEKTVAVVFAKSESFSAG